MLNKLDGDKAGQVLIVRSSWFGVHYIELHSGMIKSRSFKEKQALTFIRG